MSDKTYQLSDGTNLDCEAAGVDRLHQEALSHRDFRIHSTSKLRRDTYWVSKIRGKRILSWPGGSVELDALDATDAQGAAAGKLRPLKLTMPGKVLSIKVKEGDAVELGQGLVIVEAMKMENLLMASCAARVSKIHIKETDRLESGTLLISFEPL